MVPATRMPSDLSTNTLLERIEQCPDKRWTSQCHDLRLSSSYQPIISLNHRRIVGHEALIRALDKNGNAISPLDLFSRPKQIEDVIELDRLCRLLHGLNFSQGINHNAWLFLNVNPEVVNHGHEHGSFFSKMIQDARLKPSQLVIEVLENRVEDEVQLADSVEYYREIGCLLAIDDFGAGHSNIDRVLNLEPEIVKLDKSLINNTSAKAKRILSNLVSLLHEAGCLVVLEGIETLEQTLLAFDVDADLVQGYFFSHPTEELKHQLPSDLFSMLDHERDKYQENLSIFRHGVLSPYKAIFDQAIDAYEQGNGFTSATQSLLCLEGIQRLYLLDERGNLIGNNLYPQQVANKFRPQMAPMHDTTGANLGSRHYFRRAMENYGDTQTTRPYLSTTGAELCITLSRRVEHQGRTEVLCCDLALSESI